MKNFKTFEKETLTKKAMLTVKGGAEIMLGNGTLDNNWAKIMLGNATLDNNWAKTK